MTNQVKEFISGKEKHKLAHLFMENCGNGKTLILLSEPDQEFLEVFKGKNLFFDVFVITNNSNEEEFKGLASFSNNSYDSVLSLDCLGLLDKKNLDAVVAECYRLVENNFFLFERTTPEQEFDKRELWEKFFFQKGFRKHPCYYDVSPYESLNHNKAFSCILLEKIPEEAFSQFSQDLVESRRILHMDMLREASRRGDGHCIRYKYAAESIKAGDNVLDLACGLGYGSYILYRSSLAKKVTGLDLSKEAIDYAQVNFVNPSLEYQEGDAENLIKFPDNTFDFITSFETIEHLPHPEKYLLELKRVLKPSGRIMICAPHDWTDETGKDPNPYHLHVYTWERLRKEVGEHFLLEKSFIQIAGGAMKCHHSPRKWKEFGVTSELKEETEWAIFLGMKNPLLGDGVRYEENSWNIPSSPDFNVSAFSRDYKNPWIVKGVITRGVRISSDKVLADLQAEILGTYPKKSNDYGAALCGYIYNLIEKKCKDEGVIEEAISEVESFLLFENENAHFIRWKVSLLFAIAELLKISRKLDKAYSYYERCSQIDVSLYSPLLGNKTLDSLYAMAMMKAGSGDYPSAKLLLQNSVRECKRLLSGSWLNITGSETAPLPFGLAEASALLDKASRAAYSLEVLECGKQRRHLLFRYNALGYFEKIRYFEEQKLTAKDELIEYLQLKLAEIQTPKMITTAEVSNFIGSRLNLYRKRPFYLLNIFLKLIKTSIIKFLNKRKGDEA